MVQLPADRLTPGTLVGEYRVEGVLGQGGMATVYAAIHPTIEKRAAIKVVSRALCDDPELVERFVDEARTVNRIGHPNIVDVFSIGRLADGRPYFVMEWLNGKTLGERLEDGALSVMETLAVTRDLCLALDAAHAEGVIHRDLKPDNVFLATVRGTARPTVKLLDFGVAKLRRPDEVSGRLTRTGMTVGTPAYVSPEQARGLPIDARSDIYSLGVVVYQMVTGQLPFQGTSALDVMMGHVQTPPPPPGSLVNGLPQGLEDLILAMLEKAPGDRPSLEEVLRAVEHLQQAPEVRLVLPPVLTPRPQPVVATAARGRRGRVVAVAFVAASVVAAAVAWSVRLARRSDPSGARIEATTTNDATVRDSAASAAPLVDATPTGELILRVAGAAARVQVDGVDVPDARDGARVAVEIGSRTITATREGFAPLRTVVEAKAGVSTEVNIELTPLPRKRTRTQPRPPRPRPNRDASARPTSENYTLDPFGGE